MLISVKIFELLDEGGEGFSSVITSTILRTHSYDISEAVNAWPVSGG
jgi:hypothetical protein